LYRIFSITVLQVSGHQVFYMKICFYQNQAFEESRSLPEVICQIKSLDLEKRERFVNGKTVVLETIEESDNLFKMDFTKRRTYNAPGYSRPGTETKDFEIEEGAGFGEQTAMVYSPDKESLAIQYNHHGLRPAAIATYFGMFADNRHADSFEFRPVLNQDIYAKLLRSAVQTRFHCRIASEKITDSMYENNVPIATALKLRESNAAGHVEIDLSFGRDKRGGALENIINLINPLKGNPAVEDLKVSVKEQIDDATEILDLLEHRECKIFPDEKLVLTSGLRFSYSSRIRALTGEFKSWLQSR